MAITIIYTFIIILTGLCTNMHHDASRGKYILTSCVILSFISGFRSIWVGTDDTYLYSQSYSECVHLSYQAIAQSFSKDVFYYMTNRFFATMLGDDFHMLLLVFAIFYMSSLAILLKKESVNPLVSFIVFLSMGYFSFQMNGVRQSIAMAFTMLAYIPLKQRKPVRFLLLVCLGSLYHSTCLIFLIAYPLSYLNFNKKSVLVYVALTVICLVYGQTMLNTFIDEAANYDARFAGYQMYQAKLTYSGLIQLLLFAIFSSFYYKAAVAKDPSVKYIYVMLVLSIIFQSMAIYIAEMFRVSMYFSVFLILLIPKVLEAIPHSHRRFFSIGLSVLLLIYFFFMRAGTVPYHFCWDD